MYKLGWTYQHHCAPMHDSHRCTGFGGGGVGGTALSPQKFWETQIFWAAREIGAKPFFKEVSMFFLLF